ncbi:MAG: hypothetical protein AVDCRST_MAG87-2185 [uncultured Thermomicrobiales bacterium]|uniref:Uncharacterized protein n=1 Tax=uncultured Thermomicrobiales bacterium TaxID=1645740 RepID=A0A6J4V7F6_9BACT|nr:MAG: hypothetical protein AVDCRST_MAG87-2185 [uncultured Thermomicrobiales bacterium]
MDRNRLPPQTMMLIACVFLSTFVLTWRDAGAQNGFVPAGDSSATPGAAEAPSGSNPLMIAGESAAADQAEACRTFGGTVTMIDQPATATLDIQCTGGILDGMVCQNGNDGSICDSYREATTPREDPNAPPIGGIVFVEPVSLDDVDHVTGDGVVPDVAEDPTGIDTVVIANQVGDPVATGTSAAQLCGAFGGTPIVNQPRTVGGGLESVTVVCDGGMLDRMVCGHEVGSSPFCYRARVGQEEDARVAPGSGIEVVPEEPGTVGGDIGPAPSVAEEPAGIDTVVIANQVGHPVDLAAMQMAMCRLAGGTATTAEPVRTTAQGLSQNVGCKGGLLDGMICANTSTYSVCIFIGIAPEEPRVTPSAGIDVEPAAPTAESIPTSAPALPTAPAPEVPPMPTAGATATPPEPTASTEDPPVLPTVPTDDDTVPPGEAEDPTQIEPTPTEVVLQ